MIGNLLIKSGFKQTLELFVQALKTILGCCQWEERSSSNYVGERYFRCFALGLEITVARADDSEFTDYEFWIAIEAPLVGRQDRGFLAQVADSMARQLALNGYGVLRPNDMGRQGQGAVAYRLNPKGENKRENILTEEV